MKIALIIERLDPTGGGAEQWTVALARFLAGRGHIIHILTFSASAIPGLTAHIHVLPPGRTCLDQARHVAAALAPLMPIIVHDTGTSASGDVFQPQTGSRLLSQARLVATHPPWLRLRAAISPMSIGWRRNMTRLEALQVRRAVRVIAVSGLVRTHLVRQHALDPATIDILPNGVDVARFAPARLLPLRAVTREQLGLGQAVVYLASAFNLWLKGVDTAMHAVAQLAGAGADVRLVVAGGVPDAAWHRRAAGLGIAERVHFVGAVADMVPLFAAADVLVHPTRWDACSLSTIEAAAAAMPAITTVENGAADLIEDGRTGFVLPDPNDAQALHARMQVLQDPAARHRMGQAALAASASHDIGHNLAAVERALASAAEVTARRPQPAGR